ncbi:Hydantoinase B/oxoprolinase [Phakopsora pachyrhizi]|nr:Hydantoinase B/oxoprolinase [Phakopsora pachyrhizi]
MGRSLQQTSISTNIKERLDYSCAIFSPNGDLIANAPHLPVHLGSMSFAVRYQIDYLKDQIFPGDVIMANHPNAGGSHLPDITVITPVFKESKIVFFTASRAHHADIGGILPGSMPPTSVNIFQEGAQIKSLKIVSKGRYNRDQLVKYLVEEPAKYEGCSGTRCFRDVESDLKAQIAANNKGVGLIRLLIDEYGLEIVQQYMTHIRDNAELAVRNLLKQVAKERCSKELHALEHLDDGTPIELTVTIDEKNGSALFDFSGTGYEMIGNLNTPKSVTYSAIIYCLRAMTFFLLKKIPLNQGCLNPIEVKIPPNCFLDPSDTAAVVGGNVESSQVITGVVLKAFKASAASQSTCNNLTFGSGGKDENGNHVTGWGYYETIAGGSGAGPGWHGTSGVHTHMTNTRITDPEILERRYPVILNQFSLRQGSGGKGRYRGGEGVIREIEFLQPIQCSILSERRVQRPYGLNGGEPGGLGQNLWIKKMREEDGDLIKREGSKNKETQGVQDFRIISLGGKGTFKVGRGDKVLIMTPGGGGWGKVKDKEEYDEQENLEGSDNSAGKHDIFRGSLTEFKQRAEGA